MSPAACDLRCEGRTVLITGGSGGLGAPSAQAFAAAGARVIVLDRDADAGRSLVARLSAHGCADVVFVQQDLEQTTQAAAAVRELAATRPIDILVNNAAIYPSKALGDYSLEEYEAVQRINATAAFALSQAVLPIMAARQWGRIINISSITYFGGWAALAPYVISKAALIGLTRCIAREFGSNGITANAICPGAFPTEAEKIQGEPERYARLVLEHQSIKRRGTAADFTHALLFLASAHSGFITGQALNVDGGWFMT